MAIIAFDTLNFVEHLKAAGISEVHAKAQVEALKDAFTSSDVATKADLREQEMRLVKRMTGLALAQMALLLGILIKLP